MFTSSSLVRIHRLCSSRLLVLLAPMRVVERVVGLSRNPQAMQRGRRQSFLATATAARFLAFLPPREAIFSPWRLRSE